MILIYNIPGVIALAVAFALSALMQFLMHSIAPQAASDLEGLSFAVSLLIVGYVFEMLEMRPRLYKIPVYILGALGTALMAFAKLGPVQFVVTVVLIALFALLMKAVQEFKAWGEAKTSLREYRQIGDAHPEMHEVMLMKALFQNKFTPASQAYVEHNKEVLHNLLHDSAVHLTLPELQLLNQIYTKLNSGQDVIKWGWRLNYIKDMCDRLEGLKQERSIGRLRVGV